MVYTLHAISSWTVYILKKCRRPPLHKSPIAAPRTSANTAITRECCPRWRSGELTASRKCFYLSANQTRHFQITVAERHKQFNFTKRCEHQQCTRHTCQGAWYTRSLNVSGRSSSHVLKRGPPLIFLRKYFKKDLIDGPLWSGPTGPYYFLFYFVTSQQSIRPAIRFAGRAGDLIHISMCKLSSANLSSTWVYKATSSRLNCKI